MNNEKKRRILTSALSIFFKHGYKRISMKDIADAAGISRQGLYLFFKTKEDVFKAALAQYNQDMITDAKAGLSERESGEDKILYVFEIWVISTFNETQKSPEAKEIRDFPPEFARETVIAGFKAFETLVASILKEQAKSALKKKSMPAEKAAHFLLSATLGFKLVAKDANELRRMVRDLLRAMLH